VPTFEEVMALVALPEDTLLLCLAGDVMAEIADLQRQLDEAPPASNIGERSPAAILQERIAEAAERMRASEVPFKLRAIDGKAWGPFDAVKPLPVKDEPDEVYQARLYPWITEMVSRTCIDPVMSPEQVDQLVLALPPMSWARLQNACWVLNAGPVEVPNFVAVSAQTMVSDETSKPPTGPGAASRNGSAQSRRKSPRTNTTTETVSPAA
jgi:hypothetical protein